MNWARTAFVLTDVLSVTLVFRLVTLRLHSVYRVFCAFLLFQIVTESLVIIERFLDPDGFIDYRLVWLASRLGSWILSIWMVYALLQAILANYPGILRASRRVLNSALPMSLLAAGLTALPEYLAAGAARADSRIDYLVNLALIFERVVSTIALLIMLLMLIFILWFPVKMPRNLAIFSVGFVLYFTAKTVLLLLRSFWAHESFALLDNGVAFILCFCLAYWITFLNKQGELSPVTLGHSWQADRQSRLLSDLNAINTALARAGRR